jgi:phospholipid/cholesterol/gamma-HCH transport system permease protein
MRSLQKIQHNLTQALSGLGSYALLVYESMRVWVRRPPTMSQLTYEINSLGVQSFVIVFVAALSTGLVLAIQFGFGLERFGAKYYVPKIVAISICRELGPIFTALMLAGRVGAGMAAELASMKVSQQIDAIRALGTDPIQRLVAPKIMALLIATPILTLFADFVGIFGGMLAASSQLGLMYHDYFFKSFEIITTRDVAGGLFKGLVFGFLIASISCHVGLQARGGTIGVGNATTTAVVRSSIAVLIMDFVLTKMLWTLEHVLTRN